MLKFKANREQGFTLIELLIAMAIALVIIAALSSAFISQRKTYAVQEQVSEMIQNARAAMDMITREVKMGGYDPTGTLQKDDPSETDGTPFVGIVYDPNELKIVADINNDAGTGTGDGDTNDGNEKIVYEFYDGTDSNYPYELKRKTGAGTFQPFAEHIENFTFDYLKADGNLTTTTSLIRQIQITITARTGDPDPDYSSNDGYRTYTLRSRVTPPNLSF